MHQEFTCYDRPPILTQFPSTTAATQGVPPLTGDGSQFDAPLDQTDSNPLLDRPTPLSSGGGTFVVAFAVISALLVGLIAGFAAGYFVAQQTDPIPPPRSAAEAVAPVPTTALQPHAYTDSDTDAPAAEETRESAPVVSETPVVGQTARTRPTGVAATTSGFLQIASRPAGAQVFVDDVRVGATPMSLADVSAGAHRVRIELPGFRRWATTVNIESGARARVGASLER